jgi:uncharacterized membrane protein HdeD (DUF308 family)
MLHWARSYSVISVLAGAVALAEPVWPFTPVATLLTALFAALAVMSLLTGVLGRSRDGSYSVERAIGILALAAAVVWLGHTWIAQRWTGE